MMTVSVSVAVVVMRNDAESGGTNHAFGSFLGSLRLLLSYRPQHKLLGIPPI